MKVIHGLDEMQKEALRFVREDLSKKSSGATIIILAGDLGAGKTTFVQGMAQALGIKESVTSPTFVLEKIYTLENQPFLHFIHIDAYRLNDESELSALGWDAIVGNPENLILLEWPERVIKSIPQTAIKISLTGSGEYRNLSYGE